MTTAGAPQFGLHTASSRFLARIPRRWLIAISIVVGGLLIGAVLLAIFWPFRYSKIEPMLEDTFGCQIQVREYQRTYFPNPGFVARGITLHRRTALNLPPIATVQELYVQSHWIDILTLHKRVRLFQLVHVHVVLPPPGSRESQQEFPGGSSSDFDGPKTPVQHFEVRDMRLEIRREKGGSFFFPVSELHIENMQAGHTWTYALSMQNAFPTGQIIASGTFGPLNKTPGATPVSGQFRYSQIQLHEVGGIYGVASAFGTFRGRLDAIQTEATTAAPDFFVNKGKATPVAGAVRCLVNGLNGDVTFQNMEVRTGSTLIHATGKVDGTPHATNLDIDIKGGRAQDILRPFMTDQVPITGPVALHAQAYLAPTREGDFFHRLHLTGAFDVPSERVTDAKTEKSLTAFSQRAQGVDDDMAQQTAEDTDALSSIAGPAEITNGILTTRDLIFRVPGANAHLHGTFSFHDESVHLTGKLRMEADLSHATTGFKSILLKPLAPFFHKKHAGAEVSIAITGKPGHYQVQQNTTHNK